MRISTIIVVTCCQAAISAWADENEAVHHRIVVGMASTTLTLLDPVIVHVVYENPEDRAWTLLKPDSSLSASVDSTPVQDDATWSLGGGVGFYLGRMESSTMVLDNGAELTTYSAPDLREIVIPARGRYEFDIPLSRHRESSFTPGPQIVTVKDEKEQLRSNLLKFHVVLTRRGVDRLLQRVRDESVERSNRNVAADWLEYIHPEPRLQMRFNQGAAEEARRKKLEAEFPDRIRQWEDFWKEARDTPEMRRQLEELNGFNGIPVEIVRAMEERDDKAAAEAAKKELSKADSDAAPPTDEFHIDVADSTKHATSTSPPTPATADTSSGRGRLVPLLFAASLVVGGVLVHRRLQRSHDCSAPPPPS